MLLGDRTQICSLQCQIRRSDTNDLQPKVFLQRFSKLHFWDLSDTTEAEKHVPVFIYKTTLTWKWSLINVWSWQKWFWYSCVCLSLWWPVMSFIITGVWDWWDVCSLFFETQGCILKVPLQSKMRSSSCLSFEHRHKPAFTFMCSDFMITNSWEAGPHPIFSTHKYDVETNTENALFLQLNVLKSVNVLTFWKFNEGKGKVAFWNFNFVFINFMWGDTLCHLSTFFHWINWF